MIPYLNFHVIQIGPIPIYVWGVFVAAGFLLGAKISEWRLKKLGLQSEIVMEMFGWMALSAIAGARLFHVFLYEPAYYLAEPIKIFKINEGGMSIYGGLIAAVIVALLILKRRRLNLWRYADAIIFGLPVGLAIGRLGCFLTHQHPGVTTSFLLGIRYPDGTIRHDLGLYESLFGVFLSIIFYMMAKRGAGSGWYLIVLTLGYGVSRFLLDFLRIMDARYFGLTPAQYFSLSIFIFGLLLLIGRRRLFFR